MPNAAYISFITSIFGLDKRYDFRVWVSFAVPLKLRCHQQIFSCNVVDALLFVSSFFNDIVNFEVVFIV